MAIKMERETLLVLVVVLLLLLLLILRIQPSLFWFLLHQPIFLDITHLKVVVVVVVVVVNLYSTLRNASICAT